MFAALAIMVLVAGLVVGTASGVFGRVADAGLYATGLWSSNGPSTLPPGALNPSGRTTASTPTPTTPAPRPSTDPDLPDPVLAAATSPRHPDRQRIRDMIAGVTVKDARGSYSGSVVDVSNGKVLFDHDADAARIPASTMKLLTSAAALSILGPDHTFTTKVVSPRAGRIILVGGGDPYLASRSVTGTFPKRASITDLARNTAESLRKQKIRRVTLGYDTSLFRGPAFNPEWPSFYSDQVTKTSALWIDEGRVSGSPGPRVADPGRDAAEAFAAALRKRGVAVTATRAQRAPRSAAEIAHVSSMPLERIVEKLLLASDNDAAEVLLRQAAVGRGQTGSIDNGVRAVRAELKDLGAWHAGARIEDGSGLARTTKVPASAMVRVLRLAAAQKHPELRAVLTGLPVAGVEGSLKRRYYDDQTLAGRGLVRGKTGTLRKVHSLAGVIRTRDGSLLAYAFLINNPKNDFAATVWLDRVTAALSTCGCR